MRPVVKRQGFTGNSSVFHCRKNHLSSSGGRSHTRRPARRVCEPAHSGEDSPAHSPRETRPHLSGHRRGKRPEFPVRYQQSPPLPHLCRASGRVTRSLIQPGKRSNLKLRRRSASARVFCSISFALCGECPRQCITAAFGFSSKSPPNESRRSRSRNSSSFSSASGAGCNSQGSRRRRTFGSMKPPHFDCEIKLKQTIDLGCRAPRDHPQLCAPVSLISFKTSAPRPMDAR